MKRLKRIPWLETLNAQLAVLARSRMLYNGEPTPVTTHWILENTLWNRMRLLNHYGEDLVFLPGA